LGARSGRRNPKGRGVPRPSTTLRRAETTRFPAAVLQHAIGKSAKARNLPPFPGQSRGILQRQEWPVFASWEEFYIAGWQIVGNAEVGSRIASLKFPTDGLPVIRPRIADRP